MSHITVEGRLGAEPELKFTPNGRAVVNFPLAEQHRKQDQSGQWVDDSTSWYRVAAWGKTAENLADALRKGQPVVVTGDLKIAEFETRDGGKGRSAEITARTVGAIPTPQRTQQPATDAWGAQGDPQAPPF